MIPRARLSRAVALAATLALTPATAGAASTDDQVHLQAKALVEQGTKAYESHDYANALARFREAYGLFADPKILFNIGRAALEVGDNAQAVNAFSGFLKGTLPAEALSNQRHYAQEKVDSLIAKVGDLHIEVTPSSAVVTVDGEPIETTPELSAGADVASGERYVAPGSHEVKATAEGKQPVVETVTVHAAENRRVVLRLEAAAAGTTPPIVIAPPAVIAPPDAASKADLQPHTDAAGSATSALTAPAEPTPSATRSPVWPWVVGGVGVASLIGSGVTGYLAASDNTTLGHWVGGSNPSASASDVSSLRGRIGTEAWVSTATLGLGVVAVGVGVVFLIVERAPAAADGR